MKIGKKEFDSNGSSNIVLLLAILGFMIAGILTWAHYQPVEFCATCTFNLYGNAFWFNWPMRMAIPNSVLGMIYYLFIIALMWRDDIQIMNSMRPRILNIATLVGMAYSLYLQYLAVFVIKQICPLCLASAVIAISLFVLSVINCRK